MGMDDWRVVGEKDGERMERWEDRWRWRDAQLDDGRIVGIRMERGWRDGR